MHTHMTGNPPTFSAAIPLVANLPVGLEDAKMLRGAEKTQLWP